MNSINKLRAAIETLEAHRSHEMDWFADSYFVLLSRTATTQLEILRFALDEWESGLASGISRSLAIDLAEDILGLDH